MENQEPQSEADRLEALWKGEFGNDYVQRNNSAGGGRGPFWRDHLSRFPASRILEVGCNVGANLRHLADLVPARDVWGVDINETSLAQLHAELPAVNGGWAAARDLPFRDGWFDLVFTVAVLIHQPEDMLETVVSEMARCSRRYIACIEYTAPDVVEVGYRGTRSAFFKRPYGEVITAALPDLHLLHVGEVTKGQGFDDGLGYFVFEKA